MLRLQKIPAIDGMIIRSIVKSYESGDQSAINWFLNHSMGKPKETTNINLSGCVENTTAIDLKSLSAEELVALKAIADKAENKSD